jgi:hypothetical protein
MPTKKTILVLARSVKIGGYCLAGREVGETNDEWVTKPNWIRPLTRRTTKGKVTGEFFHGDLQSGGKSKMPEPLDIVDIELDQPAEQDGQPEDWFIAKGGKWEARESFADTKELKIFLETPQDLWLEKAIRSDRVSHAHLMKYPAPSLYLIQPDNKALSIYIEQVRKFDGSGTKKKRRCSFSYNGVHYDLALTDPEMERKYFATFPNVAVGPVKGAPTQAVALCISLALPMPGDADQMHYKLVATVFE